MFQLHLQYTIIVYKQSEKVSIVLHRNIAKSGNRLAEIIGNINPSIINEARNET